MLHVKLCTQRTYPHERNSLCSSLSDAVHLGRVVLLPSQHLGVRVIPEVLHARILNHGRLRKDTKQHTQNGQQ